MARHGRARLPRRGRRLALILLLGTVGGVGLWSVVVALPRVQAAFGATRVEASLPYTAVMLGLASGAVVMGRLSGRFGVALPVAIGAVALGGGYVAAALAPSLWVFALAHGLVIGLFGTSALFAPLVADASLWLRKRRGIALALAASGNCLAGAVWPPVLTAIIEAEGWRAAHLFAAAVTLGALLPLALLMRARPAWPSPRRPAAGRPRWGCRPTG